MRGKTRGEGTLGYERAVEWKEPPSPEELAWCGWSVARAAGRPAARWVPLARIGGVRLHLCPPGTERDAATSFTEPVVAVKRGTPARGDYVGVDGQVRTDAFHPTSVDSVPVPSPAVRRGGGLGWGQALREATPVRSEGWGQALREARSAGGSRRGQTLPAAERRRHSRQVRVAVIDVCFENLGVLEAFGAGRIEGPFSLSRLIPDGDRAGNISPVTRAPGHGTAMAGIVLHEVPPARVGLFQVPAIAGAVPAYIAPTEIAVAVAAAVESWRADVVLIAMSDGAWGTPRHLREVLREAARAGRGGHGAAIVCSVGDPAKNHSRAEDSAAIGADDLASQPWVIAAAACDSAGRWLRTRFDYQRTGSPGTTYNRFGPSVALTAPGESQVFGGVLAADDSSQAAALVAAGAAAVLQHVPETTLDDLRRLLFLTADAPAEIDALAELGAQPGLATSVCDGRDRLGHSFKVGYGRVNAAAAVLAASDPIAGALFATRGCPDAPGGVPSAAQRMAEAWEATWQQALAGAPRAARLASGYARVRGRLARAALRSRAAGEALAWLARHVRALSEEPQQAIDSWLAGREDHGALAHRVQYAVESLAEAVGGDVAVTAWLDRLGAVLSASDSNLVGAILAGLVARVLHRSRTATHLQTSQDFSTDGSGLMPSRMAPVYHRPLFAYGSRYPGRSGGGDAGGDAGGDRRRSETS